MPELRIIAGANGAGKSSLTKLSTISILVIDPDERSLNNLVKAAKIVDRLSLYDNSTSAGHQLVATRDREQTVIYVQELPAWIARSNLNL